MTGYSGHVGSSVGRVEELTVCGKVQLLAKLTIELPEKLVIKRVGLICGVISESKELLGFDYNLRIQWTIPGANTSPGSRLGEPL